MQAFYGKALGLEQVISPMDNEDFISFDAGAVQLSLHKIPHQYAKDIQISDPPVERGDTPTKVVFAVDDLAESVRELESRGVRMRTVQFTGDSGYCDCVDPEGNIFQISSRT